MIKLNYDNKKSLESQKLIYKGLRQILLKKPLSEVTVTDIKEECNISRSTFYRNFNNVVDVIDVIFDFYYTRYYNQKSQKTNQIQYFFEYWGKHRDLVHIVTNQCPSVLTKCIIKHSTHELNEYELQIKFSIFSGLLSKWSTLGSTPEEIEKCTRDILNQKVINLLM